MLNSTKSIFLTALLLLPLLVGCSGSEVAPESGTIAFDSKVAEWLGEDRVALLTTADRVESVRLDPMADAAEAERTLHGYVVSADGPELTDAQRETFVELAASRGSYDFNSAKGCEFQPGVGLRFVKGEQELVVLLCYSCREWQFVTADGAVGEDFDPVEASLVRLAKSLFPDDETIGGL